MTNPTKDALITALGAAGSAHHDYEASYLAGQPDAQWAGWYAAYTLGRLGDFPTPTRLARWLEAADGDDWADAAADTVLAGLG